MAGFQFILVAISLLALGFSVGLFIGSMRTRKEQSVDLKKPAKEEASISTTNAMERAISSSEKEEEKEKEEKPEKTEKIKKVIIKNELDTSVLEVEPLTGELVGKWEKVELPGKTTQRLSPVFSNLAVLPFSVPVSSPRVYLVRFSQPFDHLMRSSEFYKAVALRPDGTITGLPNVMFYGFYKFLASAATIWAALAVITGQKFLRDIEHRLKKIEEGIADIKEFLQNERDTRIQGNLLYLRQVYEALKNGDLSEYDINAFNNQLESIERECQQAVLHYQIDMENCFGDLEKFEVDVLTGRGLKEKASQFGEILNDFFRYSKYLFLASQERLVAIYLKTFLPVDKSIVKAKVDDLRKSLELLERKGRIDEFVRRSLDRVNEFEAVFASEETENQIKRSLIGYINENARELEEMRGWLYKSLSECEKRLNQLEKTKQITLAISIDEKQQIKEVYQLVSSDDSTYIDA